VRYEIWQDRNRVYVLYDRQRGQILLMTKVQSIVLKAMARLQAGNDW
jgi:hypothetical protein